MPTRTTSSSDLLAALPDISAKWIWRQGVDAQAMIDAGEFRCRFRVGAFDAAQLRITADCHYRLHVNRRWIADGPCRAWPEHYQYDSVDVTACLHVGENVLDVTAWFYALGSFQRLPQRPGLLVQLDVRTNGRWRTVVISDRSWDAAHAKAWRANLPKVSAQMGACESYDARQSCDLSYKPAQEICDTHEPPWRDLQPRDVAMLVRRPRYPTAYLGARVVRSTGERICLPATWLSNPGLIDANSRVARPIAFASVLRLAQPGTLTVEPVSCRVFVSGKPLQGGQTHTLDTGEHLLTLFAWPLFSKDLERDIAVAVHRPRDSVWCSPDGDSGLGVWTYFVMPEYRFASTDLHPYPWFADPASASVAQAYVHHVETIATRLTTATALRDQVGTRLVHLRPDLHLLEDAYDQFRRGREVPGVAARVDGPRNLLQDAEGWTEIHPCPNGDVELRYDLGDQSCGYLAFEVDAEAGVDIDAYGIEHISGDGRLQHTDGNRNGFRYTTRRGVQRYVSYYRRGGRYWIINIRNATTTVKLRRLHMIESTYPARSIGSFASSCPRSDRLWQISARTLQLCMEDTYTDCPLYEQALWVGDARNESLFGFIAYGATDISRRCIRLAAQSLERLPMVGAQVPSGWEVLIPAWSFIWVMSVYDDYFYTADLNFLRSVWPAVLRNLEGARSHLDEQGLFTGRYWNMFDWADVDDRHATVLHNSQLMVGALDAAIACAAVLHDDMLPGLRLQRAQLVRAINRYWNPNTLSYPDAIDESGRPSRRTSVHTLMLGLLYDIIPQRDRRRAAMRLLDPSPEMTAVASPFAAFYLYQTLEKLGCSDRILSQIEKDYGPMIASNATTVWEVFPHGTMRPKDHPTRSHCHAWSASPIYFLNRHVLGIQPTAPGGAAFTISPCFGDMTFARGQSASYRGPVAVQWKKQGEEVEMTIVAPRGVDVVVATHPHGASHKVRYRHIPSSHGLHALDEEPAATRVESVT